MDPQDKPALFSALGLNLYRPIIVPLTFFSIWAQSVSLTMVTLYWVRIVTVKFLFLMTSNETVSSNMVTFSGFLL